MNWTMLLIGFSLAVFTGAVAVRLLRQMKPEWSRGRRLIVAASVLPAVTLLATAVALWFITSATHRGGQTMEDLAARAMLTLGLGFVMLAFIGGLLGAALAQRRRTP